MWEVMVAKNTTAPKIRRFRCCQRIICNYLQRKWKRRKSCNREIGEKPRNQKKSNKHRIRNIKITASKKWEKDAKSKNIRFFQSRPRNHYGFPEIIKSGVEITYGVWLQKHGFSWFLRWRKRRRIIQIQMIKFVQIYKTIIDWRAENSKCSM